MKNKPYKYTIPYTNIVAKYDLFCDARKKCFLIHDTFFLMFGAASRCFLQTSHFSPLNFIFLVRRLQTAKKIDLAHLAHSG